MEWLHRFTGHGHRFASITIQGVKPCSESVGSQSPCLKGRREYILVDLSPASLLNTPLWQGN
jgi:hypothetical protein